MHRYLVLLVAVWALCLSAVETLARTDDITTA
jgi:hypothetical protein